MALHLVGSRLRFYPEMKYIYSKLTYLLSYFIRAPARTILSKFAGIKYHKYLSSFSLCYTALSHPILYHYYTIL